MSAPYGTAYYHESEKDSKTDEEIYPNNVYQMSGNQITVSTLDLNKPFAEIAEQLNTIAKTHFEV